MSEDISRQSHDSAMKWAAETFRDVALDLLGLRVPRITGVGSPDLPEVTVRGHVMDFLFRLQDGTNLHLEFQSAPAVLRDFLLYDVLLFRRDGRPVRTVVVYTGAVESAPAALDVGSVIYRVENVYLRAMDGAAARAELWARVRAGTGLSRYDALRIVLLPLMRHPGTGVDHVAAEALEMLGAVRDPHLRGGCRAAMLGLCKKLLSVDEWRALEVVAVKFPIVEEAIARGLVQGKAEDVLLLLHHRFGAVPEEVRQRVLNEARTPVLDQWVVLAGTAPSLEAFRRHLAEE